MSEQTNFISLEQIQQKLSSTNLVTQRIESKMNSDPLVSLSPFLEAAAVVNYYKLDKLNPVSDASLTQEQRNGYLIELMGVSDLVTKPILSVAIGAETEHRNRMTTTLLFSLRDDQRKQTLKKLAREKRLQAALNANLELTFQSENPLQKLLTRALQNQSIETGRMGLEELNALYRIASWLSGMEDVATLPSREEILRRIELFELLSPLKQLTGTYIDGEFETLFRGRGDELSTLRSYVGIAPPQGLVENVERIYKKATNLLFSSKEKPLLIFGIGGVGKSTLLAKFILEHVEAQKVNRFPFVYLDFDRPQLSALRPETLLIEAAHQLSLQYQDFPSLSAAFSNFYDKWSLAFGSIFEGSGTESITLQSVELSRQEESDWNAIQPEFLTLIHQLARLDGTKPFVFILDTFEEVQYKGVEFVIALNKFMQKLQQQYNMLRTIIAGRAPVREFDTYPLELTELDQEAALGYLFRIGIKDPILAKTITSSIGGNPLTLRLAAELVNKYGLKELKRLRFTKKQFGIFTNRLSELNIQGMLYNRILTHIHTSEVKKLAHPGMVLRRLTPEIILNVLAEPCKLEVENLEEARRLFDELSQEISLVTRSEPNVIEHRTDVRKVMLHLIEESKKELAKDIHHRAVTYYASLPGIVNRSEEFYHRLSLGESPRNLDRRWMEGMQHYLLGNLDELPPKAQAFILAKSGIESSDISIWESADMEDQNRRLAKKAANLLNSGNATEALNVLEPVSFGEGTEVLSVLKIRALIHLNRYSEAKSIASLALKSFYVNQYSPAVLKELRYSLGLSEEESTQEIRKNKVRGLANKRDINPSRSDGMKQDRSDEMKHSRSDGMKQDRNDEMKQDRNDEMKQDRNDYPDTDQGRFDPPDFTDFTV